LLVRITRPIAQTRLHYADRADRDQTGNVGGWRVECML
jgi:hypothetical protein